MIVVISEDLLNTMNLMLWVSWLEIAEDTKGDISENVASKELVIEKTLEFIRREYLIHEMLEKIDKDYKYNFKFSKLPKSFQLEVAKLSFTHSKYECGKKD